MARILTLVLLCLFSASAMAATYWVRPPVAPDGTDLNYGAEDGSDFDNAFDGPTDIDYASLQPGDRVFICGEIVSQSASRLIVPATTDGTLQNPIVFDFNCVDNGSPGMIKTWRWRCEAGADWTHNGDGSYTSTANSCSGGPTGTAETAWVYEEGWQTNKGSTVTGADADGTYYCDTGTGVCTWKPACETGTPLPCYDLLVGGYDDIITIRGDHIHVYGAQLEYGYVNGWIIIDDGTTGVHFYGGRASGTDGAIFRKGGGTGTTTDAQIHDWICHDVRFCMNWQQENSLIDGMVIKNMLIYDSSERVGSGDDHGIGIRAGMINSQIDVTCYDWDGECFVAYITNGSDFYLNNVEAKCWDIGADSDSSAACVEVGGETCQADAHRDIANTYGNTFKIWARNVDDPSGSDEFGFRWKFNGVSSGNFGAMLYDSYFDAAPIQISSVGNYLSDGGANCGTADSDPGGLLMRNTFIGSGGLDVQDGGSVADYSSVVFFNNTYGDGYAIEFANPSGNSAACTANGGTQSGNTCQGLTLRGFQRMYGKDQGSREIP